VLFPINPTLLAKYREAFKPSRAKGDSTDAQLAPDLMQRYPHRFTPLKPQGVAMRTLSFLVEQRRLLVDDKQRLVNRLGDTVKQYYPQVLA
jgi:Transposase